MIMINRDQWWLIHSYAVIILIIDHTLTAENIADFIWGLIWNRFNFHIP